MHLTLPESPNYASGDVLGAGTEGEVRRGVCLRTGNAVAIKRLFGRRGHAFYQELSILTRLQHPNVVRLMDFHEDGASRFLVYEFCAGGSLLDRLHSGEELTLAGFLSLGQQVGGGLAAIHAIGACHGDIKPANVLLDTAGDAPRWKIADFGVALDGNRPATRLGYTPRYAAPERHEGRLFPESDIYALGATLGDCLFKMDSEDNGPLAGVRRELELFLSAMMSPLPGDRPTLGAVLEEFWRLDAQRLITLFGDALGDAEPISLGGFAG